MSATQAAIGYGFVLSYSDTSSGTFAPLVEILEIKPPKVTGEKVTVQRNDSPTLFGEKIPGWKDTTDCEAKVVYNKTQSALLYTMHMVPKFWKFIKPDGSSTGAFAGFISEVGDETPLKDKMTNDIKITPSNGYTFTAGA